MATDQPSRRAYVKLSVHVPVRAMTRQIDQRHFADPPAAIRSVIAACAADGVGVVGDYDTVSVTIAGTGRYRAIPGSAAAPSAGTIGAHHAEDEAIVIFSAPRACLDRLIEQLRANHPYEMPVIDVVELIRHSQDGFR